MKMISEQDEIKIAKECGLEYLGKDGNGRPSFKGTFEQMQKFEDQCDILEEQFENEAEIIRENK